jgi:hypothetical protein
MQPVLVAGLLNAEQLVDATEEVRVAGRPERGRPAVRERACTS